MGGLLKQSTAAHILFGPFVDKTNGVDLEVAAGIITSIDHATTGIFLSKNGGAAAIRHQNVTASVLDAYGYYQVHLDTTDTDTVGRLKVIMAEAATFLPVGDDFTVLPANVYDSLMGTDTLDVQVTGIGADVITAAAIANGAIDAATFAAGAIDAAAIANAAIDNATFAADVGSTAYATNIIALAADKSVANAALATAAELAKVPKSDSNVTWNATALASLQTEANDALIANNLDHLALTATAAADMTTEVADNTILARLIANGDTSTFVQATDGLRPIATDVAATHAHAAAASAPTAAQVADAVWDEVLHTDHEVGSSASVLMQAAGTAADPWVTDLPGAYTGTQAGHIIGHIGAPAGASIAADIADLHTDIGDIHTDVGTAITNIGDVHATDLPDIHTDIATLTTTIGAAGAGLTAVPWNASWDSEVQSEVDDALGAAITEPANLSATKSVKSFLWFLFSRFFHINTQTATQQITRKADGTTALATRTVSDDGTTQTLGAGS
jgi:hypothetical protein